MESAEVDELLSIFNVSASGGLTKQEFVFCWAEWIKKATQTILQWQTFRNNLLFRNVAGGAAELGAGGGGCPEWLHLGQPRHHQLSRRPERGGRE